MTFKTVHGLGRSDYAIKAINAALDNCQSPHHVDAWLKWFDQQPADNLDGFTAEVSRQCGICAQCVPQVGGGSGFDNCQQAHAASTQCDNCQVTTVCPDDCPQPEFHTGDLEEVAHAMVSRVESAIVELIRTVTGDAEARMQPELAALIEGIRAEIALPGYVEGLLPE